VIAIKIEKRRILSQRRFKKEQGEKKFNSTKKIFFLSAGSFFRKKVHLKLKKLRRNTNARENTNDAAIL